jgi:putative transposase
MPRLPRPIVPGQPLHIVQRGNNRTQTFIDRRDYSVYLALLQLTRKRTGCAIHAYVLMKNHIHLLVTPETKQSPARMMQGLGRWYVRYFNERHGRTGTLWEGRYRSTLIDSERYFLACARYIELNPVRAGIVADPAEFEWSSFRGNAFGEGGHLLTPHQTYRALGASTAERQAAYRALFDVPLGANVVEGLRSAAKRGTALGGALWTQRIEARLERRLTRLSHGGLRRGAGFNPGGSTPDGGSSHHFSTTLTP